MFGLHGFSITKKLSWMNMLVSGAALLFACAGFISYDIISFRYSRQLNLSIQAQIIGGNAISALLFNDPKSAENTLGALKVDDRILSAGVYNQEGKFFAGYSRQPGMPDLPAHIACEDRMNFDWIGSGQVIGVRTILLDGRPKGAVYIRSNLTDLNNRIKQYCSIVLLILTASLAGAYLLSLISSKTIADPIVQLAETSRIVTREKKYSIRAAPTANRDEISDLIGAFNEMLGQIQERDLELQTARDDLEQRVERRTAELASANKELEAFSYSVSHDLRAPLRSIDGFSQALLEDYNHALDDTGKDFLNRVRTATQRMAQLIDDLINLSRVTRAEFHFDDVNLSSLARSVVGELRTSDPARNVEIAIDEGLVVKGDENLLRVAMENLIRNAWKFTSKLPSARIELAALAPENGRRTYVVRDNGAGFNMEFAQKLFSPFQRLHTSAEFKGTGVGLATVQRIIHRHGGRVWAESQVGKGASFYFTL